jgi:hypothetical protein
MATNYMAKSVDELLTRLACISVRGDTLTVVAIFQVNMLVALQTWKMKEDENDLARF